RSENRSKHAVARPRARMQNSMGVGNEPAYAGFLKDIFQSFAIGTFWKPKAMRIPSKTCSIVVASDQYLRPGGRRMIRQERKNCMSCGARDDLQLTGFLKFSKAIDEIAIATQIKIANGFEPLKIKSRQFIELLFPIRAVDFSFGHFNEAFKVAQIAVLEQGIQQ